MRFVAIVSGLVLAFPLAQPAAHASEAACEELGAGVVFKDSLYGLGTGLLGTGLVLLAARQHEDVGQILALGGLAGFTVGMGVGAVEWMTRDCGPRESAGLSVRPSVYAQRRDLGSVNVGSVRVVQEFQPGLEVHWRF